MSTYDRNNAITRIKELEPEFDDCHSQVLQNISNRIGKANSNFFRRLRERKNGKKVKVGFPRFKKYLKTVTYPQSGFKFVSDKLMYIGKVGNVPIKKHRPTVGKVKTMSVRWTRSDKWFVVLCCETPDPPEVPMLLEQPESQGKRLEFKNEVGIDLGLEKFLATSDNMIVENPRFLKQKGERLRRLQRRLNRKVKASRNRRKARLKIARQHERIGNQRKDFHWKVANELVERYDLIGVEALHIKKMLEDNCLARQLSDVGWGDFLRKLGHVAGSAGVPAIAVDPAGTSQGCSRCHGYVLKDLSVRVHSCPHCGLVLDRDVNSARIILDVARRTAGHAGTHACGDVASTSRSDRAQAMSVKQELYSDAPRSAKGEHPLEAHHL